MKLRLPKQIYILIAAAVILAFLMRQIDRQTEPVEDSILEAELILLEAELISGIPIVPNLTGWPPELLAALKEIHEGFSDEATRVGSLAALGRLYFINGFMGQARQCFDALRKIEPDEPRWSYFLGVATRDHQSKELAVEAFGSALALEEEYPNIRYNLGRMYLESSRISESVEVFEDLLDRYAWRGWARHGLAEGLFLEERYREALDELELAIAASPDVREFYSMKEGVARFAGDSTAIEEARIEKERLAFEREPYDPWVQALWQQCFDPFRLLRLAKTEYFESHFARAFEILERAAKIDGDNEEVLEALEMLSERIESGR